MKTVGYALSILVIALGVLVAFGEVSRFGFAIAGVEVAWATDKFRLERKMIRFLEDIQYKDFDHAASLHSETDQGKKDIPALIEAKFKIKPELLDIKGFHVLRLDVMSTGDRAKALCKVQVKLLNSGKGVKELEMVFFFKREEGDWYIDLQSSL